MTFTAFNLFGWIVIAPWAQCKAALRVHEQTHTAQMKRDGYLTYYWRWWTSKAYRQAYEVEAYKAQIDAGASIEQCAKVLASSYWLGITKSKAKQLLT